MVNDVEDGTQSPGVSYLEGGDHFGVKSLLYKLPCKASVRTITHCDVFSLGRADFEHVLRTNPAAVVISTTAQVLYGAPVPRI